jgi:EmrB/QacA subfamily drug resistance transporter
MEFHTIPEPRASTTTPRSEAGAGSAEIQSGPSAAPRSPWIGFSAVAVGTVMATLDGSIVNVALPTFRRELGASYAGVEWIVAGYLLVISATLLAVGRLGDLLGYRRVYVGGLLLFTFGSALCGVAPGLGPLVAARAVQALGAAATMSMGPAIVTAIFPREKRGRALGGVASVVALGLTLGPALGGFIIQRLSWRWIFLPNLPIGVLGAFWAARVLPGIGARAGARMDHAGAAFLALALGGGIAAIQSAPQGGARPMACAAVAVAGGAALAAHVHRSRAPVLDAALFRNRVFTVGALAALLSYGALFHSTLLTPFFLAQVKGLGARDLGAMLTAIPLALSVASPLAGRLSDRFGPGLLCPLGAAFLALGLASLATAGPDLGLPAIALRLAACGLGMGFFQPPNNSAVMGSLPLDRLGSGGGMLSTARNLWMVTGIALAGAIFRARGGAGPERFLAGYRAALLVGAALAIAAGVVSLLRGVKEEAPGSP